MTMEKTILPGMEVYTHVGPFDEGIAALKAEGLELITARELAEARILGGSDHPVSIDASRVAEHPLYLIDKQADILVMDKAHSQLWLDPVGVTDAHRRGKEFYLHQSVANKLREQATLDGEHGVLLLPRNALRESVPVEALADDAYARFLFKDLAGQYGRFLKDAGIDEIPVCGILANYAREQEQPFNRALWVYGLGLNSGLYVSDLLLHRRDGRVRGIRR